MGLVASLGLDISIFCDLLYSIPLLSVILGLYFVGLALSWPQVWNPGPANAAGMADMPDDGRSGRGRCCRSAAHKTSGEGRI